LPATGSRRGADIDFIVITMMWFEQMIPATIP
jgi:hypothetical protein